MSGNQSWETPDELFKKCDAIWGFEVDVCADETNRKCKHYFDEARDGLKQNWKHYVCWCNPPYKDPLSWIHKAEDSALRGATVVMLLPVDTSTYWFKEIMYSAYEIIFLNPRVRFIGAPGSPRWANMLVVWKPHAKGMTRTTPMVHHWCWKEGEVSDAEAEDV
jgi:phage N-6-adenine-methyltransferase